LNHSLTAVADRSAAAATYWFSVLSDAETYRALRIEAVSVDQITAGYTQVPLSRQL